MSTVIEAQPAPAAATVARTGSSLTTIAVLWRRDLLRFFRQKSRVVGALAQPLLFWLIIGGGLDRSFAVPGAEGLGYSEYFFPGVILMVVLFTAIFSTMSVIEDRHAGFLQAVLVAPSSRTAIVLGKTLGGATIAIAQAGLFLALSPLAGFPLARTDWPLLIALLVGVSLALTSLGFFIAWWLDSTQGYHAVMSILLFPMWILSGAMFPAARAPGWMATVMHANPISYALDGVRAALYGASSANVALAATYGFAFTMLALASWACARRA